MAACLITIYGSNGLIRLDYKIGADSYSINTSLGSFYIEDTATDITYTTLSGDLIAGSECLAIANEPLTCYNFHWSDISLNNWKIDELILGEEVYSFTNVYFPNSAMGLVNSINDLNLDKIKVTGYKKTYNEISNTFEYNYIVTVIGSDFPELKICNSDCTSIMYLIPTLMGTCSIPMGYTPIDICYNGSAITTTTTSV